LHEERQDIDRGSALIARFLVAYDVSAARQFSLGSLAFLGHACHVAVGSKRGPISALHESRFSVLTQRGAMACQGWRWIYVRLRQGLRCECRRKPNAESNHKSVCDKHSLAPDFFCQWHRPPRYELVLVPSPAVALAGDIPINSGCRPLCATRPAIRVEAQFPGDILHRTLFGDSRATKFCEPWFHPLAAGQP
jgi:hypothetical protein